VLQLRYPYAGKRPACPYRAVGGSGRPLEVRAPAYVLAVALRAEWKGWSPHHRNTIVWPCRSLAEANELAVVARQWVRRFDRVRVVTDWRPRNRPGRLTVIVEESDDLAHLAPPMYHHTTAEQEVSG
jgi:hypothetical protein